MISNRASEGLSLLKRLDSASPTCHGTRADQATLDETRDARTRTQSCPNSAKTPSASDTSSKHTPTLRTVFRGRNGSALSKEGRATSTSSWRRSTILQLIKRERRASEIKKSALRSLSQRGLSVQVQSGATPGLSPPEPSDSLSPTEAMNYSLTKITLKHNSAPRRYTHITKSFRTTPPSETNIKVDTNASYRSS